MGRCRICGGESGYSHDNAWCFGCFFFNIKGTRFWLSIPVTIFIIQLPIIDGNGVRLALLKALFDSTSWQPFNIAYWLANSLIIFGTFLIGSFAIYKIGKKFGVTIE